MRRSRRVRSVMRGSSRMGRSALQIRRQVGEDGGMADRRTKVVGVLLAIALGIALAVLIMWPLEEDDSRRLDDPVVQPAE